MVEWPTRTLGDLVTLQRGIDLPSTKRSEGDVPVMGSFGVTGFHNEAAMLGPGVTVGRSGASIGVVSYIDRDYWPLNTCLYVKDFHGNNRRFAYYLLSCLDLSNYNSGSAQPSLNRNFIHPIPLAFPARHEQDAIAELLGLIDDKIELNQRMNETLESMARAIFRDWFVDFGPTRAKAEGREPYLAPELWDLFPETLNDEDTAVGWAAIPLKQLGRVVTGKTPSTKNPAFFGDDMPFLKIPDMRGRIYVLRTSTSLSEEGVKSQKQKTLPAGSVSVSCIATPGLVTFNHRDTQTNQQINTIIPSDRRQSHFVFWSCRRLAAAVMRGGSGGSVFHNMNKSSFENLRVVYPGKEFARCYSKTVNHIHNCILLNEYESDTLGQTRDLLLSKLMSGEIRLREAEQAVEAVA